MTIADMVMLIVSERLILPPPLDCDFELVLARLVGSSDLGSSFCRPSSDAIPAFSEPLRLREVLLPTSALSAMLILIVRMSPIRVAR